MLLHGCLLLLAGILPLQALTDVEFRVTTQAECFKNNAVLFHGQCYLLLSQGPCQQGELLVFFIGPDDRDMIGCRRCHCCQSPTSVFWPKDGTCRKPADAAQLCQSQDRELSQNLFDEGECRCKTKPSLKLELSSQNHQFVDNSTRLSPHECYDLFKRGPCLQRHVLQPEERVREGICVPDLCARENENLRAGELPFVRFNNECYQLGKQGPCQNNLTSVGVDAQSLKLGCYHLTTNTIWVVNCNDSISKCSQETSKPDASQQYLDKVAQSFKNKRQRRANPAK